MVCAAPRPSVRLVTAITSLRVTRPAAQLHFLIDLTVDLSHDCGGRSRRLPAQNIKFTTWGVVLAGAAAVAAGMPERDVTA